MRGGGGVIDPIYGPGAHRKLLTVYSDALSANDGPVFRSGKTNVISGCYRSWWRWLGRYPGAGTGNGAKIPTDLCRVRKKLPRRFQGRSSRRSPGRFLGCRTPWRAGVTSAVCINRADAEGTAWAHRNHPAKHVQPAVGNEKQESRYADVSTAVPSEFPFAINWSNCSFRNCTNPSDGIR